MNLSKSKIQEQFQYAILIKQQHHNISKWLAYQYALSWITSLYVFRKWDKTWLFFHLQNN